MKKIILSVLTLFMMFSCGNKTEVDVKGGTESIIKIGVPEPLTGDLSQYGVAIKEGIEFKVAQVNNEGGVNGKKIELVVEDTKGDLQEAINIMKKMISVDKVDAVLGEAISANSFAIAELAQKAKIPMITPAGTRFDITENKDFVFRATFTDPFQGEVLAKYIKKLGYSNIAVLTNTSSDYSVGVAKSFKEVADKINLKYDEQKYTKEDKDFKSLLTNIKNSGFDSVLIPDYYNTVGLILSQAKELGLNVKFFGADGWDGIQTDFVDVSEGAIFTTQFDINDSSVLSMEFISKFKEKYAKEPNLFTALGYDAATIIVEALKSVENPSDHISVKEALSNVNLELITGELEFDANRNPKKVVSFLTIENGKLVLKEKF
ncbi:ABC transporter substrate-binding protein [Streptobacillus moniliformis]|uniref:ABC transporter substrate-binding protein n=1 Tax=Streptobacillus moniliformis TaxID=34105 RepID=UPI0007E46A33|nr:ABC transporter substrate-binding protein [Streptobacillus moniliformis]